MAENSKIEWTDHTQNFWIGCTKVSPACDHCYAERFGFRQHVSWGKGNQRRKTSQATWKKPIKWDREAREKGIRLRVFASSLCDIFDTEVPEEWRFEAFRVIDKTPNIDWLVLTKRSKPAMTRLSDPEWWRKAIGRVPEGLYLPQIWLGNTVEDQKHMDLRWRWLKDTPAAVKFLSMEPLLGHVKLPDDFLALGQQGWVISGGESGPFTRPTDPDIYRSLRDQCADAGVPYHFKQYGDLGPIDCLTDKGKQAITPSTRIVNHAGRDFAWVGKKVAGRILDGRTWDELPTGPLETTGKLF